MSADAAPRYSLAGKRVWVAGHRGMVGGALCRRLAHKDCEVLTAGRETLDLRRQAEVEAWMAAHKPEAVFVAAATVGGILVNDSRPAEFIGDNIAIAHNIVEAAHLAKVKKLLFIGSSCMYPKLAPQPVSESALLDGLPEPTNQWSSVAKIAGAKLCQAYRRQYGDDFIVAVPTNLYGPGDNFDLAASHVLPALMRKVHEAALAGTGPVEIWGSGAPRRELMYVDDAADAMVFLMEHYADEEMINIGGGDEVSIRELAERIARVVNYRGGFHFAIERPDGAPRKALDGARLRAMGWRSRTRLDDGLARTLAWYEEAVESGEARVNAA
jgi:GDP-L-fucose synthase